MSCRPLERFDYAAVQLVIVSKPPQAQLYMQECTAHCRLASPLNGFVHNTECRITSVSPPEITGCCTTSLTMSGMVSSTSGEIKSPPSPTRSARPATMNFLSSQFTFASMCTPCMKTMPKSKVAAADTTGCGTSTNSM